MAVGQRPIGVVAPNPGISPEIEGAPASMPGGNDGKDKTTMTGTPATVAVVPPPISPDLQGGPNHVAVAPSKVTPQTTSAEVKADNPTASTDTEHETPAVSPEQQQLADAVAGSDRKIAAYRAYIDSLPALETPEKRAKREKLEKSRRIVGAVSDGLRAMSNLWFTSQYAPNMYNHEKDSQLNETNKWIDKAKAERDKTRDAHLRFAIGLGDAENERAKTLRELEAQQEARELAREAAQRDAEKHGWLALLQPDKQREQKGKADKAGYDALSALYEAENKPTELELKNATETARAGSYKASAKASEAAAANSYASAAAHNRSNQNEFFAWDEHGNEYKFKTEAAAIAYAKQHGTYKETAEIETTDTSRTSGRRKMNSKQTKTKKGGYPTKPDPTDMDDPTA